MVSFRIASRFLKASRSQTVLIVLGIAIAISVQIFVGVLISSLQTDLVDAVTGNSPHITVSSTTEDARLANWEALVADVKGISGVTAVTVAAYSPATVGNGAKNTSTFLYGFDLATVNDIYGFDGALEGEMPSGKEQAIIGVGIAEELSLAEGQDITIMNYDFTTRQVEVSGIFDMGNAQVNTWVVADIGLSQAVFNMGENATQVQAQVQDIFEADIVAQELEDQIGASDYEISNWKETSEDLLSALQSQSLSSYMIQAFVLISVVIAIASVLAITVIQKSKQIGILKAMGIKDRQASMIFLYQGLLLGILGAFAGIGIGLFLLYGFVMGTSSGGEALINIVIDYNFITLSGCIAVLSAVVASVLPARRSQKLSPVEVIRNG